MSQPARTEENQVRKAIGFPDFALSIYLSPDGRPDKLSGSVHINSYIRRHRFWGGLDLDPAHALHFLVDNWKDIAGPFVSGGTPSAEINLSGIFPSTDIEAVVLKRDGVFIGFDFLKLNTDLGTHSVVVVEVLLRLGLILSCAVDDAELKAAWLQLVSATDLLPFDVEGPEGREDRDQSEALAAAYHSRALGLSLEDYKRLAIFSAAEHLIWLGGHRAQPTVTNFTIPMHFPESVPDEAAVADLVLEASRLSGEGRDKIIADAVEDSNNRARQVTVYRRWYNDLHLKNETQFSGEIECTIRGFVPPDELDLLFIRPLQTEVPLAFASGFDRALLLPGRLLDVSGSVTFVKGKPFSIVVKHVKVDEVGERFARMMAGWRKVR